MLPTIQRILDLESVRHGLPAVLAGVENIDREVRWVHVAGGSRRGEIVLAAEVPQDSVPWLDRLAETGVAGVIVHASTPIAEEAVRAAQRWGLPLVQLRRETRLLDIVDAVHALVAAGQFEEFRRCEEIHRRFTELSLAGARAATVVSQAAALAKCAVVLENTAHRVLAFEPAGADPAVLDGWESLSRKIVSPGQTGYDHETGWLVARVGAQGQDWGRLLVRCTEPLTRHVILAERAAGVIALDWLARDGEDPQLQAQHTLLESLLEGDVLSSDFAMRAAAMGVPLDRCVLVAAVIRHQPRRDLVRPVREALRDNRQVGFCAALDGVSVGVLLALSPDDDPYDHMGRLADAVHRAGDVIVGVGQPVASVEDVRGALLEAKQVAAAANGVSLPYVRLSDLGLRGLMYLLRDDHRVQAYVERELGPLLEHAELVATLRAYVDSGGNKTDAAAAAHLSRQALYDRLKRAGQLLGADLDAPHVRASLQAALHAFDAIGHS
ncbi:purine catabolism regulator [Kibdelosporangium banguiense]|uniref:Purine catabolism regulator n=1 Tax=Kibdelosporangium banguiense TaxID=1365924 RepID=A0ABS4TWN3_9PSEU|nr:helix-turn-helix domain-containing protein [Kibdelosporangium banguiense]MBP2328388.1 purine catabolism regulator [Kibdelosporangium banguiense]